MRITLLLISAMFFQSCQWSEDRYITRKVSAAEVTGRWVATPFAIESLRWAGHRRHLDVADHQIEVRADGTCTFQSFLKPGIAGDGREPKYVDTPEPCHWRLLDFPKRAELWIGLDSDDERQTYYYFAEEDGRLVLWRHVGDPDAWKYMEFVKTAG